MKLKEALTAYSKLVQEKAVISKEMQDIKERVQPLIESELKAKNKSSATYHLDDGKIVASTSNKYEVDTLEVMKLIESGQLSASEANKIFSFGRAKLKKKGIDILSKINETMPVNFSESFGLSRCKK